MSFLGRIVVTYRNRKLTWTGFIIRIHRHVFVDTLEAAAREDRHAKKYKNTVGDLPCLLAVLRVTDDSIYTTAWHTESLCAQRLVLKLTMIQQRWMSHRKECNRTASFSKKSPEHKWHKRFLMLNWRTFSLWLNSELCNCNFSRFVICVQRFWIKRTLNFLLCSKIQRGFKVKW